MKEKSAWRIAIVGAGFGGLGTAIRLREQGFDNITIFESQDDVGGVWRANRYPGAACDVPSHLYSFSFAPGTNWSRRFAPQAEILAYMQELVDDYGLRPMLRLGTTVQGADFDADSGLWSLRLPDGSQQCFEILIAACGQLRNPVIPALPGVDSFDGETFHSAYWPDDIDLSGRRVAVVGTGASAIQFVPEIAKTAAQLRIYQRSAPWILSKPDREYPAWERRFFNRFPQRVSLARRVMFISFEAFTYAFVGRRWIARPIRAMAHLYRWFSLRDHPHLRALSTPDYDLGCKRVLLSNDWYPTLKRDNVELVEGAVQRISESGVVGADGEEWPADVLIWGTGFAAGDFVAPMEIRGPEGVALSARWGNRPEAYLGTTVSGFPNLFILYGPNTNHGSGSVPYTHECQISYILDAVRRLHAGPYRYLDLRPETQQAWREEMAQRSEKTVWKAGGCASWYLNEEQLNTNNWPGPWLEFKRRTAALNPAEYQFVG